MFDAAVAAAQPAHTLARWLPAPPRGRTIIVGAGKAAAAMAQAVEAHWPDPLTGLVITRYGHTVPCRQIEVVEAAHPVPDESGVSATTRLIDLLKGLTADDLVICLLSGGGSALLTAPPPRVSLGDERELVSDLLACGATIAEMNCVRKHLSTVKGGRLAQMAAPARLVTLAISDVPGDDPSTIASGPTVADATTREEALAVIAKYGLAPAQSVMAWLRNPASETPKPGALAASPCHVIAAPLLSLEAAAAVARTYGLTPIILGDAIEGQARDVAKMHAAMARQVRGEGLHGGPPCVLLSGGETTVTVRGTGRGGRNVEFLLALALELAGAEGIHALAADTDGIDGSEENAGAMIGPDILQRAAKRGLSAADYLANNDAYSFFEATGSLLITGATLTNVNDFRAILIEEPRGQGDHRL